jgi:hypothetical protein
MKNKIIFASLLSILPLASVNASQCGTWSAGIQMSTLGAGAHLAYKFNDYFKLRGMVNYFQYNKSISASDFDIDGKLKFLTVGLLGDFHLLQNGFRVTAGLVYNDNRATLNAKTIKSFTVNGRTYTPAEIGQVDGSIDFRPFAPYLGMGYDSGHNDRAGLGFTADVGVLFQGKVRGKVNNITGLLRNDPQAISDVKDEVVNEVNDKTWIKAYPVISLGVNYKF